ncbi:hypothetical protein POTOM_008855 [Populus tomentosa]|uniref:Uncharacterized protein n=1 Tax=Populus tomentosa TaxID=118781 RepID=A0A8X8DEF9_POPTO|nr:hypothetical protein POTOM_008855 [Populus tomentosa]
MVSLIHLVSRKETAEVHRRESERQSLASREKAVLVMATAEGRSSTVVVLMGEHDKAITLEYDDMSVDMDISPINSPNNCETKPPEPHDANC